MSKATEISVVIPVKNEAGNIDSLVSEIHKSLKKFSYEIIYVNDGSDDKTELELKNNMKNNKKLRVISHENSQGQSAALRTGIKASNSTLIATLDGDGQNDPSDLPKMIDTLKSCKDELVLIGGVRVNRKDNLGKKIASKFSNISCEGFVDDIRKYYHESDLQLVAPTVATGSRTKIIESLVYGLPVLSTSEAADGLIGLKNKENIFLAETPKKFLNHLKHIIENPSILKSIRKNGRDTYDALYSQNSGKNKLKELIQNTFGEK